MHTGPLQESAVWIDESQTFNMSYNRSRSTVPVETDGPDDPLGISDEANE